MTFFQNLFTALNGLLASLYSTLLGDIVAYVSPVLLLAAFMAISMSAIYVMMGWTDAPVREVILSAFIIAVVLGIAGAGARYGDVIGDFLRDLPNELLMISSGFTGTPSDSVGKQLDLFGDSMLTGINALWKSASGFAQTAGISVICVMFFIAWVAMSGLATITLFVALTMSTAIAAIGPLFILSLLFKTTRDYFSKWLTYAIQFALLAMFIGILLGIASALASSYFVDFANNASGLDWFDYAAPGLILFILAKLFGDLPSLASSLTGGIGISAGNAAGNLVGAGTRALTKPGRMLAKRTAGEALHARRTARVRGKIDRAEGRLAEKQSK